MAIKDVLLALSSYPQPTPTPAITHAVETAAALGASLSAITFQIEVPSPAGGLAATLLDIPGMVAAERHKSAENAKSLIDLLEREAQKRGVAHANYIEACLTSQMASLVAERAMTHDLTMVPIGEHAPFHQYVAESAVFGSGRPVIVFPETPPRAKPYESIVIAWDYSRPAARAVADALPLLTRARTVRIVTLTREKNITARGSTADLLAHLALHGIAAAAEEEDAAGRSIGQALTDYAKAREADLLVMGAYAHSRMRDFVLGGATKTILASPPLPVFLSH